MIVIMIISLITLAVVVGVVQSISQRERVRSARRLCVYCRTKLKCLPGTLTVRPVCWKCGRTQPSARMNRH